MHRIAFLLSLCLLSAPAFAQWHDAQGKPLPNAPDRAQIDGFGALLLVTPDADWKEKWDTPPGTTPSYTTTTSLAVGETVTVLTFFKGQGADGEGNLHIRCDMRVTRPDGTISSDVRDADCARGPNPGPNYILMTQTLLQFIGEPSDPRGVWRFDITLRDVNRDLTLPLTTQVTLTDAKPPAAADSGEG